MKVITPDNISDFSWWQLWAHRELFLFFAWKDIRLRYEHLLIGACWAIAQPLATTIVLSNVLHKVTDIFSQNTPYPVFAFIGLLFWTYFASSLNRVSTSLTANRALITKASFPKLILPLSTLVVGLVDFIFIFIALLLLMTYYRIFPTILGFILLAPSLLITMITSLSLGLFFSFLQVKYRDVRQLLPFITSLLFFLTPVIYSIRILPPKTIAWISYLNPLAGVIETMRAALLGQMIYWQDLLIAAGSALLLLLLSLLYFRKSEKELADIL